MTTRAALYCRISRDKEGAGLGVDRQETDCRDLADRLGWTVAEVYVDNDISASGRRPRPAYRRMLDALRSGEVGAVVAWHTDRLHRRPTELEEFIAVCEERGVAVQTVRAGTVDLATASGRMVARMLGAAARHEAEHSAERIRAQKAQAAAAGEWIGGARGFGFNHDGATTREDEAELVADAARRVLEGVSVYRIAAEWQAAGVTTPHGHEWRATNIRRVLLSARIAGLLEHRGEVVGPAPWPAIVSEDTWRALRVKLTDPHRTSYAGVRTLRWLGSGLYRCGVCDDGSVLRSAGRSSGARASGLPIYRCRTGLHCSVKAEPLDEYVHGSVAMRLAREDVQDLLPRDTDSGAALRSERTRLREQLDEAVDMFTAGVWDRRAVERVTGRINPRLADIERTLARSATTSALDGIASADDPVEAYLDAPVERQRAVVDALLTVTVRGARPGRLPGGQTFDYDRVVIEWRTM